MSATPLLYNKLQKKGSQSNLENAERFQNLRFQVDQNFVQI